MVESQLGIDLFQIEVKIHGYPQQLDGQAGGGQHSQANGQGTAAGGSLQRRCQRKGGKGQDGHQEAWSPGMSRPPQEPGCVKGKVAQHHGSAQKGFRAAAPEKGGPRSQGSKQEGIVPEQTPAGAQGQPVQALEKGGRKALLRQVAGGQWAAKAEPVVPASDNQGSKHRQPKEKDGANPFLPSAPVVAVEVDQQEQAQKGHDDGVVQTRQEGHPQAGAGQQDTQPILPIAIADQKVQTDHQAQAGQGLAEQGPRIGPGHRAQAKGQGRHRGGPAAIPQPPQQQVDQHTGQCGAKAMGQHGCLDIAQPVGLHGQPVEG